jgi:hypothetical protein
LVGAARLVERVERRDILLREGEVEDSGVVLDALAVGGLGEDREVALQTPADEDLRRCRRTRSAIRRMLAWRRWCPVPSGL